MWECSRKQLSNASFVQPDRVKNETFAIISVHQAISARLHILVPEVPRRGGVLFLTPIPGGLVSGAASDPSGGFSRISGRSEKPDSPEGGYGTGPRQSAWWTPHNSRAFLERIVDFPRRTPERSRQPGRVQSHKRFVAGICKWTAWRSAFLGAFRRLGFVVSYSLGWFLFFGFCP